MNLYLKPLTQFGRSFSICNSLIRKIPTIILVLLFGQHLFGQSLNQNILAPLTVTQNTGKKPQSKLWRYAKDWYTIMPATGGTYIWKLVGDTWTQGMLISDDENTFSDVKSIEDTVHILIFNDAKNDVDLVSLEFDDNISAYTLWSKRGSNTFMSLGEGADKTVVAPNIDLDANGNLWMAYKVTDSIVVRYSSSPFTSWSLPILLDTGVVDRDLACIAAFSDMEGDKIGVMWSNQSTQRFGFKYHLVSDSPETWSVDEIPGNADAQPVGSGMADDHVNMAIGSDGTLYAAVKTSYDSPGFVSVGLLVRRPNGSWDVFYEVDESGTKPIIILNEDLNLLLYVYTYPSKEQQIVYRQIPIDTLDAPGELLTLFGEVGHEFASSTKDTWSEEVAILAFNTLDNTAVGIIITDPSVVSDIDGDIFSSNTLDAYFSADEQTLKVSWQKVLDEPAIISLINAHGQVIFSNQIASGNREKNISISDETALGVYWIQLEYRGRLYSKGIILR